MSTEYQQLLEKEEQLLFSNKNVAAVLKDHVFTAGQVTIFPTTQYIILEGVPERDIERCAVLANQMSIAVFDGLGAQGTNILIQNGSSAGQNVAHFGIEVIPRREGDGLSLSWEGKPLAEDEQERLQEQLSSEVAKLQEKKPEQLAVDTLQEEKKEESGKKEENYLLKSLDRLP